MEFDSDTFGNGDSLVNAEAWASSWGGEGVLLLLQHLTLQGVGIIFPTCTRG